ncbi:M4 family metallopeptidase [Flaviaesturariibacter flavus]|nr:M4 family metallopeptidase [Flaviaesturariibacter flavus]
MIKRLPARRLMGLLAFVSIAGTATAQESTRADAARKAVLGDPKVARMALSPERETPSLIVLRAGEGYGRDYVASALGKYLSVRSGQDELRPANVQQVGNSLEVLEYQQYYKGIKVDRAGFKALMKNGTARFFNGAWYDVPASLPVTPALDEATALGRAKARIGARRWAWEDVSDKMAQANDRNLRAALEQERLEYLPKGELVIVNDFNNRKKAVPRLAWKFNLYAAEPVSRAWVYIDALDGRTLLVDKIIKHFDGNPPSTSVSATVQTRYAGQQVIRTKRISGNDPVLGLPITSSHPTNEVYVPGSATYVLIDDTRGNGIETYDMNGVGGLPLSVPQLYLQGKSFTDIDNVWNVWEHHRSQSEGGAFEAENDDIAWDAHWGASVVYDYWLAKHNRLSYDNKNARIRSFIHYGPAYDNAFWNGSVMTYGDGSGPLAGGFKALTSLDVCGHEIGHAVCSSTSDLVYQGESGAMNEALSDIWAACIEHFAMTRSGSTVPPSAYRPFYIGEQIGADENSPLRRMDNPKAQGNPDTYGGTNWQEPNCAPNLANDQCGVHTNSGVLNHWFFLMTAGSLNGTRPAGMTPSQYYMADSDDERNDLGKSYRVNGIGFDLAEQVTFLMETMLSSTATYAEARAASIEAATVLSNDPCSNLVESVTNAWYAVGVGDAFVKPCIITYGFISKNGASLLEAADTSGCYATRTFEVPVLLPAGGTATLTTRGTAINGTDYTVNTTSLTNSGTGISRQNFVVTVKNDAVVEPDETIILNISVTNAGTSPVNSSFTITLIDDDVVPVIGEGQRSLLSETFTRADGFDDPSGWSEVLEVAEGSADPMAFGKNQWGIFSNKLAITGREGLTGTVFPGGTYNSNSESQTLIKSPLLDSRGLSQLKIQFDYEVQGEVDVQNADPTNLEGAPVFDYMAVAYSLDGVNFVELNTGAFNRFASVQPASGTFTANLPPNLANKQFYLAFRWVNDGNAGGPGSVTIDNLSVTGTPRRLESEINQPGRETLLPGQDAYFYSIQDGDLIVRASNNSTRDYGCTTAYLEKTGNGTFNLYQGGGSLIKVSDKIVRIEPVTAYRVSNTVTFYFTEQQLLSLEQNTGISRANFKVYQANVGNYLQASYNNTTAYNAVYTPIPGVGASYTISSNMYLVGSFALGGPVTSLLRTRSTTAKDEPVAGWSFAPLYPNPGRGTTILDVTSPAATRVVVEVVNSVGQVLGAQQESLLAGRNRITVDLGKAAGGNYRIRVRGADGQSLNTQGYLKQ